MGCCCSAKDDDEDAEKKKVFVKGGERDITKGPLRQRRCTDIPCIFVYVFFLIVYLVVTFWGVQDGDPMKLARPRDYRGDYCSSAEQWNSPNNFEQFSYLSYMMNVTEAVDLIAKQLVCSSAAEDILQGLLSSDDLQVYRCACCKAACRNCLSGSFQMDDLSDAGALSSVISSRIGDLTNPTQVSSLFSPTGPNGDVFNNMWEDSMKFFVATCARSCDSPTGERSRNYTYTPAPDAMWKKAWDTLATNPRVPSDVQNTIATKFRFLAVTETECPYHPRYCVPFPGVKFVELANKRCIMELTGDVADRVSGAATTALQGATNMAENAKKSFGEAVGVLWLTWDTFFIVGIFSFVIGLIFLILLRFFVAYVVWCALFLVLALLVASGAAAFVKSGQCSGASFTATGKEMGVAGTLTARAAAKNAANKGMSAVSGSNASVVLSEDMSGYGDDYRGGQTRTKSGRLCEAWDAQEPHAHNTTAERFPESGLESNYCRNPGATAPSIWCYTTDVDKRWELCKPIGTILDQCPGGYEVDSASARETLRVIAYIFWVIGGLWVIVVVCLKSRIDLAISINEVAATFIYSTPTIVFVPLAQIFIAIAWCAVWFISASFLLSQVPAGYSPTGSYATYEEAYGSDSVPGACTDKWPTGFVWHDEGDISRTDDPCSGNKGDISGLADGPKCWRCAPPRYVIDPRLFVSFFYFLWNNALVIAFGQCIVAGAVGVWFFTPKKDRAQMTAVKTGVWNSIRYHFGSLAFGSFILALVQFMRYCMKYIEKQAEAQKNRALVIVTKVIQYILWCFEKCIAFLNKNAYIQIALLGEPFCTSAKAAFYLIIRNILRFGMVTMLGSIIHVIGSSFITICTVMIGYAVVSLIHPDVSPIVPIISYLCIGYVAAKLYMSVFGLAVDTALQCFIAVEEMDDPADEVHIPAAFRKHIPAAKHPASGAWK